MTKNSRATGPVLSSDSIPQLPQDVLLLIFTINSENPQSFNPDQPQSDVNCLPLDTTRTSAQVCWEWRRILLSSPSIWGRLLDWRSLNQDTDHWREEVLRRSGNSLLRVEGYPFQDVHEQPKKSTLTFFAEMVEDNWERIERLPTFLNQSGFVAGVGRVIGRAAPNLEVFTLSESFFDGYRDVFYGSMFAGHAPRLRIFRAIDTHCFLEACWMSQLRELSLGRLFDTEAVCKVLAHTPLLESLGLDNNRVVEGYQSPTPIHLPHLRRMNVRQCISYLANIEPPSECYLHLWEDLSDTSLDLVKYYASRVSKIVHNNMFHHLSERLYLECKPGSFILSETIYAYASRVNEDTDINIDNMFDVRVYGGQQSFNFTLHCFLESLTSPLFSTVTDLMLTSKISDPQTYLAFSRFLSSFSSVENLGLVADADAIPALPLNDPVDSSAPIFPKLRTLIFRDEGPSHGYKSWIDSLRRFLSLRRDQGIPVTTVDFTRLKEEIRSDLVESLDLFVGMKVTQVQNGEIVVYTCGGDTSKCP